MRSVLSQRASLAAVLASIVGLAILTAFASPQEALPAGLESPDQGVVCNGRRAACYDRYGPSIGLTEVFLGHVVAERLTTGLRGTQPDNRPGATFSPANGVECVRQTGPCRFQERPNGPLTAALFGPPSRPAGQTVEMRAIVYGEWHWVLTRYGNDTEARPNQPERFTLRFAPDGSIRARVDCNSAGGKYRLEGNQLAIELTYSTLAACETESLAQVFQQNLAAAATYFMRNGQLFLDLKYDTGTMEFNRPLPAPAPTP